MGELKDLIEYSTRYFKHKDNIMEMLVLKDDIKERILEVDDSENTVYYKDLLNRVNENIREIK